MTARRYTHTYAIEGMERKAARELLAELMEAATGAGSGRDRIGTRRSKTAGKPAFCLVKAGVRIPLAPPDLSSSDLVSKLRRGAT
jgi:hypothetical protein